MKESLQSRLLAIVLFAVLGVGTAAPGVAQPAGELPLAGFAATFAAGEEARVALFLGVPGGELVQGAPRALQVVARARLADDSGTVVDRFEVTSTLDLTTRGEALARSSLKVYGDLRARPGSYRLTLELRAGDRRGSRSFPFDVPATEAGRSRLLPPIFIDDIGEAIVLYEDSGETPPEDYPFVVDDTEIFVPEIVPEIGPDMPRSRVALLGYHLTAPKMLVDTGLIAADGTLLGKERLQLVGRSDTEADGLDRLYFGLDTQGLVPGDYQLNVSLHDFGRGATEQTAMPFRLLDEAKPGSGG